MQRKPCVRVLSPGSSCPTAGGRKAEHAAEANGDGPSAAQRGVAWGMLDLWTY